MPSRFRRARLRVLVVALSAVVALAAAEVAWRVFRTRGFGPTTNPSLVTRDDVLGWRYRPGVRARHVAPDFDVLVEIDAEGWRDATPVPDGVPWIAALGDSIAFGWGVEEREAFPALLETLLDSPVGNRAVSGYGTDQELLVFRRHCARLAPRVVLVTVSANDLREIARPRAYGRAKPRFEVEADGSLGRLHPPAREGLLEHLHLARSLVKALEPPWDVPPPPEEEERHRRLQMALFRALDAEVEAAGGVLVVVVFQDPWLPPRLEEEEIRVLDVAPALAAAEAEAPTRFPSDPHWTPFGHRVVAESLAAYLRTEGLVP